MKPQSYAALFLVLTVIAGCATTHQSRSVETTGFLSDYILLRKGGEDEALLLYRNDQVNFAGYHKVLLDGVQIWKGPASKLETVPEEDLRRLSLGLHAAVKATLEEDYELVDAPGPGVMRIRLAITEAGKARAAMNVFSTVVPVGRVISAGQKMATGTHSFVGAASVEGEITDSLSGEVLLAGVDRRTGGKTLAGSANPWSDVEEAFDYWAERILRRLRTERAESKSRGF
jgi:hypothetical protein